MTSDSDCDTAYSIINFNNAVLAMKTTKKKKKNIMMKMATMTRVMLTLMMLQILTASNVDNNGRK